MGIPSPPQMPELPGHILRRECRSGLVIGDVHEGTEPRQVEHDVVGVRAGVGARACAGAALCVGIGIGGAGEGACAVAAVLLSYCQLTLSDHKSKGEG